MRRFSTSVLIVAFWFAMVACGCVLTSAGESEAEALKADATAPSDPGPRVQGDWQEKMGEMLKSDKGTEAWGLFSAGGWSNSGQVIVLLSKDRAVKRLVVVPPNKKEIAVDRALTDAEMKSLEPAIAEAASLEDVDVESFDGPEFELVHIEKHDGGTRVVDRLLVRDPGTTPRPRHQAVLQAFDRLRKP